MMIYICRNCKPRNRPSFRQILLHLDIASADVLSTPQETYFKSQVTHPCRHADTNGTVSVNPKTPYQAC